MGLGIIRLKAVAGDALLARRVFGGKGLLIPGGARGGFDGIVQHLAVCVSVMSECQ
jgi:hypothetical protein